MMVGCNALMINSASLAAIGPVVIGFTSIKSTWFGLLMNTEVSSDVSEVYMKMDITVLAMEKDGVRESGAQAAIYPPVRVPVRRFRQYNTHADH